MGGAWASVAGLVQKSMLVVPWGCGLFPGQKKNYGNQTLRKVWQAGREQGWETIGRSKKADTEESYDIP